APIWSARYPIGACVRPDTMPNTVSAKPSSIYPTPSCALRKGNSIGSTNKWKWLTQWATEIAVSVRSELSVFTCCGAARTSTISIQTPSQQHDLEKACLALDAGWVPVFRDHAQTTRTPGKAA